MNPRPAPREVLRNFRLFWGAVSERFFLELIFDRISFFGDFLMANSCSSVSPSFKGPFRRGKMFMLVTFPLFMR